MVMKRTWLLVLAIGVGAVTFGCRSVSGPRLTGPGPAPYQQAQAERFDPYPETESGPAVVGSRPMEYEDPPPEVQRARWLPWNWRR
jgi:hypothetical protein